MSASIFVFFRSLVLMGVSSDGLGSIAGGLSEVALYVPFAAPVYLYFVGRRYVRVVHGGFKSVLPFVLLYSGANLVLWACGFVFIVVTAKFPPG